MTSLEREPNKNSANRNIILTGATGAVGSNVLFELIRKYVNGTFIGKIILLSRGSSKYEVTAKERIVNLLSNQYAPDYLNDFDIKHMMSFIEVVEAELNNVQLSSKLEQFQNLKNCYVIHSAATTNLANNEKAFEENYQTNYLGTLNLFKATHRFITKFTFISTAYSCGVQSGLVPHNYKELKKDNFRNHYESLKARIEIELEAKCEASNVAFQILRPAIICGRTIETPLYALANFHVFYGYARFFHQIKNMNETNPINIKYQMDSGAHIIPVDYVCKIIVAAFDNDSIRQLTIAPAKGLNMKTVIEGITHNVGYTNSRHTDVIGAEPNDMEALYYEKVHVVFGPYMDAPQMVFDTKPLEAILPGIPVPEIAPHYKALVDYAVNLEFQTLESLQFAKKQDAIAIATNPKNLA